MRIGNDPVGGIFRGEVTSAGCAAAGGTGADGDKCIMGFAIGDGILFGGVAEP